MPLQMPLQMPLPRASFQALAGDAWIWQGPAFPFLLPFRPGQLQGGALSQLVRVAPRPMPGAVSVMASGSPSRKVGGRCPLVLRTPAVSFEVSMQEEGRADGGNTTTKL